MAFALLKPHEAYHDATTRGILAPENRTVSRWVGREFVRDSEKIAFPEQPRTRRRR
jgi:hypothetical protein